MKMKETAKKLWVNVCSFIKAHTWQVVICSVIAALVVAGTIVAICMWTPVSEQEPASPTKEIGVAWNENKIQIQKEAEEAKKEAEEAAQKAAEAEKQAEEAKKAAEEAERLAREEAEKQAEEEAARKAAEEAARKAEEERKAAEEAAQKAAEAEKEAYESVKEQTANNLTQEQKEVLAANAATCRYCGQSRAGGNHYRFICDTYCPGCGVFVEAHTCHTCGQ